MSEALFKTPRSYWPDITWPISIMVKFFAIGSAAEAPDLVCVGERDSSNNNYAVDCSANSSANAKFTNSNNSFNSTGFALNSQGVWSTLGYSLGNIGSGSGVINAMFFNKAKKQQTSGVLATGPIGAISDNYISVGGSWVNAAPYQAAWTGLIEYCYVWNRALTLAEMEQVYQDPYQIFQQPLAKTYFSMNLTGGRTYNARRMGYGFPF